MKKSVIRHGLFIAMAFCGAFESGAAAPVPLRWTIDGSGKRIVWNVREDKRLPHKDMLEMSGLQSSIVLSYEINEAREPKLLRFVLWPQYRTQPNDTHATCYYGFTGDSALAFEIGGKAAKEVVDEISFDGIWRSVSRAGDAVLVRSILPCADKPAAIETVEVLNSGKTPLEVKALNGEFRTYCIGCDARFEERCDVAEKARTLKAGESATWTAVYSIRRVMEKVVTADAQEEIAARKKRIAELTAPLVLETGDRIVDAMFYFAKIRAGESIFRTKRGLMHSPGGGPRAFYAATWCNDQAEYAGPWFGFTQDATALLAATNAYAHYMPFMGPDYAQIPSSVIAEGFDYWNSTRDRGDAAMWAYGAARFLLAANRRDWAKDLLPGLRWTLEYSRRQMNAEGVVGSYMDELEGRFPHGKYNLCTSTLYYDALRHAAIVEREIGDKALADDYEKRAAAIRIAIEKFFGAQLHGFKTYRYFEDCKLLRSWIGIPLAMGIYDRVDGTIDALFSPYLWTGSELYTQEADPKRTVWDRSLLCAMRGICAAGRTERVWGYLKAYSQSRLLGEHVPYALECSVSMSHLSAENALYCRIFTEGLFGLDPNGFGTFAMDGKLPKGFKPMRLKNVRMGNKNVTLTLTENGVKVE